MKHLLLAILILTSFTFLKAQEEMRAGELIIDFINKPGSWNITVKIEAFGTVWNHYHNISTTYPGGNKTYSSIQYPEPEWHASDLSWDDVGWEPVLSLGLYEVSIWEGINKRAWFFIDYRTSHLPYAATLGSIDVVLSYDVTNKYFSLTSPNLGNVSNASYYAIWELKQFVQLQTDDLEDYWVNCLTMIPDIDNHPKFIFGPYPLYLQGNITGYKIYRSGSHSPGQQPGNFNLLTTLESDEFTYTDNTVTIGMDYTAKSYYTTCVYEDPSESSGETGSTNTIEVRLQIPQKIKAPGNEIKQKIGYKLDQNYPNPFNPTTIISWYSSEDNFVTLKVFDILGREVASLVNDFKDAGTHSIEFNASEIPGGVYFYKIQIGNYIQTRKLILQK